MSTGNVALQANFKTPSGALLNVYGQTADEFEFNLKAFGALLDIINATDKAVQAASTSAVAQVQASLGATVTSPAPQVSAPAPVEASAPNTGAPSCRHGVMQFVDGTKKGKTWKGYFCPQPKEATDKCSPIFNKG
jgi:hypothetical protein